MARAPKQTNVPAADRNVSPKDNAPAAETFHDFIVRIGGEIREHKIAVDTGTRQTMERFVAEAVANPSFMANDFDREWSDWYWGEGVRPGHDSSSKSEMSRMRGVCNAGITSAARGGNFIETMKAIRETHDAAKAAWKASPATSPKPIQYENAVSQVATLQNAKDTKGLVTADQIKAKVAPVKVADANPFATALSGILADVDKLLNDEKARKAGIVLPLEYALDLQGVSSTLRTLQLRAKAEAAKAAHETENA